MAKLGRINTNNRRIELSEKDATKRKILSSQICQVPTGGNVSDSEYNEGFAKSFQAMLAVQKLSRNGSPTRVRNRCLITGRPRGYYRKFGLCRNKLRELAHAGSLPGVIKASW